MARLRRVFTDAAAAGLIGLAVYAAFGHAFLNYDTFYALLWGDDLVHGRTPQYDVPVAPTPHPLAIAVGGLLSPLGDAAEETFLAIGFAALGALGVGLFRLGEELYAWPVGLLAAALILTREPILNFGIRGYVDLPALALVVWAAVLEARRPRRGAPVLVLLALAGLLRPEAWLFAAVYWAWCARPLAWPDRLRMGALAVSAPVLWALSDLLVTGNPLWSLTGTRELASELERETGLDVVELLPRRLGEILRLPELVAAVLGCAAGLVWLRRRTLLPLAVAVANGLSFVAFAVAGLSLLTRYMFLASAMLALFAALAGLGWTALERDHPRRTLWLLAGLSVLVGIAAFTPMQADRLSSLRDDVAKRDRIQADLLDLVRSPEGEGALSDCRPFYVPNHRAVPSLAYWTGTRPSEIVSAQLERPGPGGLYLDPATPEVERLGILDPKDPKRLDAEVPPGYRLMARNRSWNLYSGCG